MIRFAIWESPDGLEAQMSSWNPENVFDVEGNPMRIVFDFWERDFFYAQQVRYDYYGYGTYYPPPNAAEIREFWKKSGITK